MFQLNQKVAVITGGGSGIGKAICKLFARQGAAVHVVDFNRTEADATAEEIRADGGKAFACYCNIADQADVQAAFQSIWRQSGRLDILINNAGIAHVGNLEKTSAEDLDRVLSVNVRGLYHCLYQVLPLMKGQGGGVILNMASVAAWVGISDRFAYSMSKGAVAAMTLSIAKDYLKEGIRCNSISPARVHTPFVDGFLKASYPGREEEMFEKLAKSQPIGRMAKPEEIAALALYLCADEASFVTGCDYPIDGGFIHLNN